MKCQICNKRNVIEGWSSHFCQKCGLYLDEPDLNKIVEELDSMIVRWNTRKEFKYYKRYEDGHIAFNFKSVKRIIEHITFGDDVNFTEFEDLVKVVSYLTIEFQYNITSLALHLFAFATDHYVMYEKIFKYWMKVGHKERNRTVYEYSLYMMLSNGTNTSRRGRKKERRLKTIIRSLPNEF